MLLLLLMLSSSRHLAFFLHIDAQTRTTHSQRSRPLTLYQIW